MSRTMNLCCTTCGESIWIGQNDAFYSGMPEVMEGLRLFLIKHRIDPAFNADEFSDHHLVYMAEPYYEGWTEVDTDQYKAPDVVPEQDGSAKTSSSESKPKEDTTRKSE